MGVKFVWKKKKMFTQTFEAIYLVSRIESVNMSPYIVSCRKWLISNGKVCIFV